MKTLMSAALLATIALTGCYKYTVKIGKGGDLTSAPAKSVWNHHFIAGVAGEAQIDVSSVCPSADATVKIQRSVVDGLLANITGAFLWEPSTIEVYCADGRVAELSLDEQQQRRFAKSELFAEAVVALAPERVDEANRAIDGL